MDKELEEAIKRLNIMKNYICYDSDDDEENQEAIRDIEAIETVLKELENSISKNKIKNKLLELDKEEKEIYKKDISNNELYSLSVINEKRTLLQELLEGE